MDEKQTGKQKQQTLQSQAQKLNEAELEQVAGGSGQKNVKNRAGFIRCDKPVEIV